MKRASRWSRCVCAAVLPLLLLSAGFVSGPTVRAVGCGPAVQLPAAAAQAQERWRYVYGGSGGYEVVGWSPTEVALLISNQGCAQSWIGLVGLDLVSGQELWRVTSDQWTGMAGEGTTVQSDLVIVPTTETIYAYDLTTGQLRWSLDHGYGTFAEIVANDQNVVVIAFDNNVIGIAGMTGSVLWQQSLPAGSIADWEDLAGGPLVGIGRPGTAGQDVQAFGIDKATGTLLWQTSVGQTVASTGGSLGLASNASGTVVAEVSTDATSALVALVATSGGVRWSVPVANDNLFSRVFVTNGAQPAVVQITGGSDTGTTATAYDVIDGTQRWQNQTIGPDSILADDTHLVGGGPAVSYPNALVMIDGESGQTVWSQPYALVDGSFPGTAQISNGVLIFTPQMPEGAAPSVMGVDLASGNVLWDNTFPEFDLMALDGLPAGLVLVTGDTADEAVAVALAP